MLGVRAGEQAPMKGDHRARRWAAFRYPLRLRRLPAGLARERGSPPAHVAERVMHGPECDERGTLHTQRGKVGACCLLLRLPDLPTSPRERVQPRVEAVPAPSAE